MGLATVPVYLIQETESTLDLLKLIIEYYTPMNLMDKALFTRAALELGVPRSILVEDFYPLMELPPRAKLIDQVLFLLSLPVNLQNFVVDKAISLKRALIFQRANGHLEWVNRLIVNLNIGINMTVEIIQNIWEMAQRDDQDFETKAREMGLWEMADTKYDDNRQAVMALRNRINAARYPHLTAAGEQLVQHLAAVDLPTGVAVKWDPYFEQQGVDISFHARDTASLNQVLSKLSDPAFNKIFEDI